MKPRAILFQVFFLTIFTVVSWASGTQEKPDSFTIVSTTSIVTDVVQNIAGDKIVIRGLIAKGGNPHNFDPTPRDMATVESADLIFVNGLGLEESLLTAIQNVKTSKIIEVSSTVDSISFEEVKHDHDEHDAEGEHEEDEENHDEGEEDHHHDVDPHTWMSPLNVIAWADVISEALSELDPENAEVYGENAEAYKADLRKIDVEARELFSSIADEKKILVSDHKIFGYFAIDYNFENLGSLVPGFSTNAEISPKNLVELIEEVNEHGIPAIFVGNTAGDAIVKLAQVLNDEVDQPLEILTILTGSLTEGGQGDDYLSFIRFNINQIAEGIKP